MENCVQIEFPLSNLGACLYPKASGILTCPWKYFLAFLMQWPHASSSVRLMQVRTCVCFSMCEPAYWWKRPCVCFKISLQSSIRGKTLKYNFEGISEPLTALLQSFALFLYNCLFFSSQIRLALFYLCMSTNLIKLLCCVTADLRAICWFGVDENLFKRANKGTAYSILKWFLFRGD